MKLRKRNKLNEREEKRRDEEREGEGRRGELIVCRENQTKNQRKSNFMLQIVCLC